MDKNIFGFRHPKNKVCWCGSERKYKDCHLNKIPSQGGGLIRELAIARDKYLPNRINCLCGNVRKSDCSGGTIKAHSVSKVKALAAIADDGHVYRPETNLFSIFNNPLIDFERIGVNKASIFTGFCNSHDSDYFSAIDNLPRNISDEHCFLFSLRAVAFEHFRKLVLAPYMVGFAKSLDPHVRPRLDEGINGANDAIVIGKSRLDQMLLDLDSQKFMDYESIVFHFDYNLFFAVAGGYEPIAGLNFEYIQDVVKLDKLVTLNVFPHDSGICAVFTWRKEHKEMSAYIDTFGENFCLGDLLFIALDNLENMFFSPRFWEGQSDEMKIKIRELMQYSMGNGLFASIDKDKFIEFRNYFRNAFPQTPKKSERL